MNTFFSLIGRGHLITHSHHFKYRHQLVSLPVSRCSRTRLSVVEMSSEFRGDVAEILGGVIVFAVGIGKAVKFGNLWDQKEVYGFLCLLWLRISNPHRELRTHG
ncbi:hypothetical protein Droror1_Dr00006387 [Drosera rotundifolia]